MGYKRAIPGLFHLAESPRRARQTEMSVPPARGGLAAKRIACALLAWLVMAPLLRAAFGIEELSGQAARTQVRAQIPGADPADLVLFDDMLGIRDPEDALPDIAPDARRRRLTALIKAAALARRTPRVFVIGSRTRPGRELWPRADRLALPSRRAA